MNYWLHRISHHAEVSYPLLGKNILSIGFSDFTNDGFVDRLLTPISWEKRWQILENEFDNIWGNRPRTRHTLWRFLEGFKKGDIIVVPGYGDFSIFEIVSNKPLSLDQFNISGLKDWNKKELTIKNGLLFRNETLIDLGFFWEVKPIAKNISRKEFADSALTSRMKIRTTNAFIGDLKDSISKAIESFEKNKPINLYSNIIEKISSTVLKSFKSELTPQKFENLVKFYFQRNGATEVYIPSKNENDKEGDADVIAIFEPIKTIIYSQVKFHNINSETNDWAVHQIKEYRNKKETMDDGYTKIAWVITSANKYSESCIRLAKEESVQLIDGIRFAEMIIEAGILTMNSSL